MLEHNVEGVPFFILTKAKNIGQVELAWKTHACYSGLFAAPHLRQAGERNSPWRRRRDQLCRTEHNELEFFGLTGKSSGEVSLFLKMRIVRPRVAVHACVCRVVASSKGTHLARTDNVRPLARGALEFRTHLPRFRVRACDGLNEARWRSFSLLEPTA